MNNIQLSKKFWLSELAKSSTADRHGIDNWPYDDVVVKNLALVAVHILQPVRNYFNIPFSPSSGYRSAELNAVVKGSKTSQHMTGQAVDFEIAGIPNYDLALWIKENLNFDQLILEFAVPGEPSAGWVHCSYVSPDKNRNQVLSIVKGQGYVPGLVK
jgi:zinc D-Ala-D-Ala carboxypeptidase